MRSWTGVAWGLALTASVSVAGPAAGQIGYATPEVGWSDPRGVTVGGRIGKELAGFDFFVQGLRTLSTEGDIVDPGSSARRSWWRASLNAAYTFDRSRAFAPYVGVGGRYGRSTLTVVSSGYRSTGGNSGFGVDVLAGVSLPRLPASPWLEYRKGDRLWTITGGVRWRFGGGSGE